MVNNNGIASNVINICNAVNIRYNKDRDNWYNNVNTVIALLENKPGTVIFLLSSWATAG